HPEGLRVPPAMRDGLRPLPPRAPRGDAGGAIAPGVLARRRRGGAQWRPQRRRGPRKSLSLTRAAPAAAPQPTPARAVSQPWLSRLLEREPKAYLKAVSSVSFSVGRRETVALVGESGSGKSTVARMTVGLLTPSAGTVTIDGIDMWAASSVSERQKLRRRLQMIFQDPFASLNPRWRVDPITPDPLPPLPPAPNPPHI